MRLWEHSAAELLVLPDDALGLLVLAEFGGDWNVHNFFNGAEQHHDALYRSPGVRDRLADAWAWLESNGLVGFQPAQSTTALARRVTAAGRRALQDSGFQRLQAAVRLNSELHPALASTSVRSQF